MVYNVFSSEMCLMDHKGAVCKKCYKNCLLFHQTKHDDSPDINSFFKIMYGKKFSEILITPPRFSRAFVSLAGKKTYLEDYRGQKWEVDLAVVDGTLAIQKGWREFFLDHHIELGDLLVFHYITESHFIVLIWGRSGCPKTFPVEKNNQNKRPKTTINSFTRRSSDRLHELEQASGNDCLDAHDVPQLNTKTFPRQDALNRVNMSPRVASTVQSKEKSSEKPQLVPDVHEELYFLSDREPNDAIEDDREHLLNLFNLELPESKSRIAKKEDKENESDMSTSKMINKKSDARDKNRKLPLNHPSYELPSTRSSSARQRDEDNLSDVSTSKVTEKKTEVHHIGQFRERTRAQVSGALYKSQSGHDATDTKKRMPLIQGQGNIVPSNKIGANLLKSDCSPPPIWSPSLDVRSRPDIPRKSFRKSYTSEPTAVKRGETNRIAKQEPTEFKEDLGDTFLSANLHCGEEARSNYGDCVNLNPMEVDVNITNIVKSEPVDFCDSAPAPFIRVTCVVPPDNESFLELPEPLPVKGRKSKQGQKLIFLRNQAGKDWPVIYHHRYSFKVLTSGWDAFRKANNICPGDECGFVVDNVEKGIFRVNILNR